MSIVRIRGIAVITIMLLAGCASAPPGPSPIEKQVVSLQKEVAQLKTQLANQQQQDGYYQTVTPQPVSSPAAQNYQMDNSASPTSIAPAQGSIAPPASAVDSGPFVNVKPHSMDLPAPTKAMTTHSYAVYLSFTDISTLRRVDEFLDAHGITDRQDATNNGIMAIYLGVYSSQRAAENRQQQIEDQTGLKPQIQSVDD